LTRETINLFLLQLKQRCSPAQAASAQLLPWLHFFLPSELCERVYPGLNRVEKKHRNAVARAAKAIPSIKYMMTTHVGAIA
jgi:hypothetical protein